MVIWRWLCKEDQHGLLLEFTETLSWLQPFGGGGGGYRGGGGLLIHLAYLDQCRFPLLLQLHTLVYMCAHMFYK